MKRPRTISLEDVPSNFEGQMLALPTNAHASSVVQTKPTNSDDAHFKTTIKSDWDDLSTTTCSRTPARKRKRLQGRPSLKQTRVSFAPNSSLVNIINIKQQYGRKMMKEIDPTESWMSRQELKDCRRRVVSTILFHRNLEKRKSDTNFAAKPIANSLEVDMCTRGLEPAFKHRHVRASSSCFPTQDPMSNSDTSTTTPTSNPTRPRASKQHSIRSVLHVQALQRRLKYNNPELIANVYKHFTKDSSIDALQLAIQDQNDVLLDISSQRFLHKKRKVGCYPFKSHFTGHVILPGVPSIAKGNPIELMPTVADLDCEND